MKGKEVIPRLANRYRGLYLPVEAGMSQSLRYRQCVLQGRPQEGQTPVGFLGSEEDTLTLFPTPEGEVETIYLEHREDFELFLQKLRHRCEPVEIPREVGAMLISGVINWEKIDDRRAAYLDAGGVSWREEFKRFTSRPENYKDRVLVLSGGPYSGYSAKAAGYSPEEWKRISVDIRRYHECTHYVCQLRYPGQQNTILDEVLADAVGLLGATGAYDRRLALAFLGVTPDGSYTGGRLSAYVSGDALPEAALYAREISKKIENICKSGENAGSAPFSIIDVFLNTL